MDIKSAQSMGSVIYIMTLSHAAKRAGPCLVEQLGRDGFAVVLGRFSVKLSWEDVGVELLVVVLQFVSVDKHLEEGQQLLEAAGTHSKY